VGGSTGDVDATIQENIANAAAAVDYVLTRPEVDPDSIGIFGHSEGGLAVANLGANDPDVDFVVAMAGTAVPGTEILYAQNERIMLSEGATEEEAADQVAFVTETFVLLAAGDLEALQPLVEAQVREQIEALPEAEMESLGDIDAYIAQQVEAAMGQYESQWFQSFLFYDPTADWEQVQVPLLAVFGGLDVQVPADQNAPALEAALTTAGNEDFTIVTVDDANHLFQSATTGALSEYGTLGSEFTPEFLPLVTDWILEHTAE
jgi:uncharacterized protein